MQRKLTKEEFIERVTADMAEKRKRNAGIYFDYVKERRADATKKYKWPRRYVKS